MRMILFPEETAPENLPKKDDETEVSIIVKDNDPFADALASLLDDYIAVVESRDGVAVVIAGLMEYLKTTYSDKYTDTSSPLDTKDFLYSDDHGKSVNMFCAAKYMQRYMTDGYSKSNNPQDLFKAIHYLLFELARLKLKELKDENEQERNNRAPGNNTDIKRGDREIKGGDKGAEDPPKRKRGRPRKNDKGE